MPTSPCRAVRLRRSSAKAGLLAPPQRPGPWRGGRRRSCKSGSSPPALADHYKFMTSLLQPDSGDPATPHLSLSTRPRIDRAEPGPFREQRCPAAHQPPPHNKSQSPPPTSAPERKRRSARWIARPPRARRRGLPARETRFAIAVRHCPNSRPALRTPAISAGRPTPIRHRA